MENGMDVAWSQGTSVVPGFPTPCASDDSLSVTAYDSGWKHTESSQCKTSTFEDSANCDVEMMASIDGATAQNEFPSQYSSIESAEENKFPTEKPTCQGGRSVPLKSDDTTLCAQPDIAEYHEPGSASSASKPDLLDCETVKGQDNPLNDEAMKGIIVSQSQSTGNNPVEASDSLETAEKEGVRKENEEYIQDVDNIDGSNLVEGIKNTEEIGQTEDKHDDDMKVEGKNFNKTNIDPDGDEENAADSEDRVSTLRRCSKRRKMDETAEESCPMIVIPVETVIKLEPREWVDETPSDADRDPDAALKHGLWNPGGDEVDFKEEMNEAVDGSMLSADEMEDSDEDDERDDDYKPHVKKPGGRKPYKKRDTSFSCTKCNKTYKIRNNLRKHERVAHPSSKKTQVMEKAKTSLDKSSAEEPSEQPRKIPKTAVYGCQHCDKKFLVKELRDKHARTHGVKSKPADGADNVVTKEDEAESATVAESAASPDSGADAAKSPDNSEYTPPVTRNKKPKSRGNTIHVCFYCGKKFLRKDHRDKHHRTHRDGEEVKFSDPPRPAPRTRIRVDGAKHYREGVFQCDQCSKIFKRKDHLAKHLLTHSGEKQFSCELCGKMLSRKDHLVRHMTRCAEFGGVRPPRARVGARPSTPVECEICGRKFLSAKQLTKHSEVPHTREEPYDCSDCQQVFPSKNALRNHRLIHNDENALDCEECGRVYKDAEALAKHRISAHSEETVSYECEVCDKVFARKDHLKRHFLARHTAQIFQCEQCGESFSRQTLLDNHMVEHLGDAAFKCKYCSKKFAKEERMLVHQEKHTSVRNFQCESCGKAFWRNESLKIHRLIHTDDAVKCKLESCSKVFGRQKDMERHYLHVHTSIRPFSCEKCERRFASQRHLNDHKRMTQCDAVKCFCGKVFSRTGYLKVHQSQDHGIGVPLFPCEICGKQFLNKGSLGNHYPVHSGKKLFQCDECPKAFTWKGALTRHQRLHVRDAQIAACTDGHDAARITAEFKRTGGSRKFPNRKAMAAAMRADSARTLESIGSSLAMQAHQDLMDLDHFSDNDPGSSHHHRSKLSGSGVSGRDGASSSATGAKRPEEDAQVAATSAIQNAVTAAIHGAGEAATQRAMTAAIQGAVVAAMKEGQGKADQQGAVTSAIQSAVTAAIQGAVAAAVQNAMTTATAGSAACQLADESRTESTEGGGQRSAWNLATSGSVASPPDVSIDVDTSSQSSAAGEPGLVANHHSWNQTLQSVGYSAIQNYVPPPAERSAPPLLPFMPHAHSSAGDARSGVIQDGRGVQVQPVFAPPAGASLWWPGSGPWQH